MHIEEEEKVPQTLFQIMRQPMRQDPSEPKTTSRLEHVFEPWAEPEIKPVSNTEDALKLLASYIK